MALAERRRGSRAGFREVFGGQLEHLKALIYLPPTCDFITRRADVADRATIGAAEAAHVRAREMLLELQVRKLSQGRESARS